MRNTIIKKDIEVEIPITPEDFARYFADMYDDEQARFFEELAKLVNEWEMPFSCQLDNMMINSGVSLAARSVMRDIGRCADE